MKKRFLGLALVTTVVFNSLTVSAKSNDINTQLDTNEIKVDVASEKFPNAKIITEYIDLEKENITFVNGKFKSNSSEEEIEEKIEELNSDQSLIEELKNNRDKKLIGIVDSSAFVRETVDSNNNVLGSQLLDEKEVTKKAVQQVDLLKTSLTRASNKLIGEKKDSDHKLTIRLAVWDQSANDKSSQYVVSGNAFWSSGALTAFNGKTSPSTGDDIIGFNWGGGFDFKNDGIKVIPSASKIPLASHMASSEPNNGVAWRFQEHKTVGRASSYAKQATIGATLVKNKRTGNGNTTGVVLKYIHTYQSYNASGAVSIGKKGIGSIDLDVKRVPKQWDLYLVVNGLKY